MSILAQPAIRQAELADAEALAKLIDLAGEGIPSWLWTRTCVEGQHPLEIGTERASRESGGFSYRNALVADLEQTGGHGSELPHHRSTDGRPG